MIILGLSLISWLAIAIMLGALAVAWSKKFIATGALVVANILVMVLYLFGSTRLMTPSGPIAVPTVRWELTLDAANLYALEPIGFLQLFTSMFLHADFFHIFGNMLILVVFALHFEERIGPRPFLVLYLLSGLVGAITEIAWMQFTTGDGSQLRLLGASGAVFGIIGAFAGAFPNLVLPLPLPLGFIMVFVRMRVIMAAMAFAAVQVLMQIFLSGTNVAFMAHLGGLGAGLLLAMTYVRSKRVQEGKAEHVVVDMSLLEPFAQDSSTRHALRNMRTATDEPEVFHAWLEQFLSNARCTVCGDPVAPQKKGRLVCRKGHEFDVRQKGPTRPSARAAQHG